MIQTEQLSPDTIMFHVRGPFHQSTAKELGLSVFRSHHLGFTTFLFDLSRVLLIDEEGVHSLALIGQGVQAKGGVWRVLRSPLSLEHRQFLNGNLDHLPK